MDIGGFWIFLERSARETANPRQRIQWLEYRLSRISRIHVEDFQNNLAGRRPGQWTNAEWPWWEELAYVANRVHERSTGQEDSLYDALAARGQRNPSDPDPTDRAWDFDNLAEIQRRLPRLASLFPRQRYLKA